MKKEFINRNKLIIKAFQIEDKSGKTNFVIYKGFIKVLIFSNSFEYIQSHSKCLVPFGLYGVKWP